MARVIDERTTGRPEPLDVARIRKDFPILERVEANGKPLVYLDSAATSQKPRQVLDALLDFYERHNANIHRGVYSLAEEATAAYEDARAKLARFVGAPEPACVVFNRGTTEGLLSERTRLVAVTGMSNVLGTAPPVRRIADAAHAVGALVLVDGAQLVPHAPVDVRALDCDFLTVSGHKMLGPTASGGLYARRELLEEMDPFMGGGEMIREVHWEDSTWNDVPWKFEAGTMNIAQEVGLAAAVDYLEGVGMEAIQAHEAELTALAAQRLTDAGARVFGPPADPSEQRGSAVSFEFRGIHPHDLAEVLNTHGVCVRAGHHCAQPLMRRLGVPATTRASFGLYNTPEEIDALVVALADAGRFFG